MKNRTSKQFVGNVDDPASAQISATSSASSSASNPSHSTPPARPGKVQQARSLVTDSQYPPDELLDRIATLLATKLSK
jgi:hypothetical protein